VTGADNWKHLKKPSRKDCIYLTDVYGGYFAWNATRDGELMAVLELESDYLDLSKMLPDEDWLAEVELQPDPSPKGLSDAQRTRWFRDRLERFASYWIDSWNALGTCCYKGEIPPEAISRIAYFPAAVPLAESFLSPSITVMSHALFKEKYALLNAWLFGKHIPVGEWFRVLERSGLGVPLHFGTGAHQLTHERRRRFRKILDEWTGCSVWSRPRRRGRGAGGRKPHA
jgi:hypothetical protein